MSTQEPQTIMRGHLVHCRTMLPLFSWRRQNTHSPSLWSSISALSSPHEQRMRSCGCRDWLNSTGVSCGGGDWRFLRSAGPTGGVSIELLPSEKEPDPWLSLYEPLPEGLSRAGCGEGTLRCICACGVADGADCSANKETHFEHTSVAHCLQL